MLLIVGQVHQSGESFLPSPTGSNREKARRTGRGSGKQSQDEIVEDLDGVVPPSVFRSQLKSEPCSGKFRRRGTSKSPSVLRASFSLAGNLISASFNEKPKRSVRPNLHRNAFGAVPSRRWVLTEPVRFHRRQGIAASFWSDLFFGQQIMWSSYAHTVQRVERRKS